MRMRTIFCATCFIQVPRTLDVPGGFDVHDALILTLRANDDVLFDRRTIQRLIYFESLKLQPLQTITYRNNFYGPFSHEGGICLG